MGDSGGPDYVEQTTQLKNFLQDFMEDDTDGQPQRKYFSLLQQVANRRERRVHIDLDDVYDSLGDEIGEQIKGNAKRYQRLIADAIDEIMPSPTMEAEEDVADILQRSREQRSRDNDNDSADPRQRVPKSLLRRYEVLLMPRVKEKAVPLRQVLHDPGVNRRHAPLLRRRRAPHHNPPPVSDAPGTRARLTGAGKPDWRSTHR
jgi:hypothetical protein